MRLANRQPQRPWAAGAALLVLGLCTSAHAALGDDVASVGADSQRMQAQVRISAPAANYSIHELQTPSSTVVREYVSAAGKVFAVSWRGPFMPDLSQTLGRYFSQYQDAAAAPHPGHRHLQVHQAGLVIRSGGRLRAFYGYAYVPSLVPAGLPADAIK